MLLTFDLLTQNEPNIDLSLNLFLNMTTVLINHVSEASIDRDVHYS